MRAYWFLLLLAVFPLQALATPEAFSESFRAYVKVRGLEEEKALISERVDLDPKSRELRSQELGRQLMQARQYFKNSLQAEQLSPWEKDRLEDMTALPMDKAAKMDKVDPTSLEFLAKAFPQPKQLSPLAWKTLIDAFGPTTQRAFLRSTFQVEDLKPAPPAPGAKEITLLWISNPFERYLSKQEASSRKSAVSRAQQELKQAGYKVEQLELSPYGRLDDQAEELRSALDTRLEKGKVLLVSSEEGSAVLRHALDLNPRLLRDNSILGWINVNGRLFGHAIDRAPRNPASVNTKNTARPQEEAERELHALHRESQLPPSPLGAGFPVMNLLESDAFNATGGWIESVEAEGRTLLAPPGTAEEALAMALPAISAGR
jgi:hypothetical protein